MKFNEYLNKIGKTGIFIFGLVVIILIGLLDFIVPKEISLSILYLIPIVIVAWKVGKFKAIVIAFISACVWAASNEFTGSDWLVINTTNIWNTLVRLGFFIIIAVLIDMVIKYKFSLEEKILLRTSELSAEIESRTKTEKELKKKSDKLSLLTKRIQVIKEEENTKIAREIHDELGQALTAIKIETVSLSKKYANDQLIVDRLFIVTDIVDDIIKSIRKISTRLRPRLLDELGLIPAIEWHLKDFQNRTGINYTLESSSDSFKLTQAVSNNIFRIFQEAITNIIRHSRAKEISINIHNNSSGKFIMEITDDGIGLPEGYMDKTNSLGILGMKERAQMLKGTVDVIPAPECGTKVIIKVPLNHHQNK
jgi:signal transduction histidine kinase